MKSLHVNCGYHLQASLRTTAPTQNQNAHQQQHHRKAPVSAMGATICPWANPSPAPPASGPPRHPPLQPDHLKRHSSRRTVATSMRTSLQLDGAWWGPKVMHHRCGLHLQVLVSSNLPEALNFLILQVLKLWHQQPAGATSHEPCPLTLPPLGS